MRESEQVPDLVHGDRFEVVTAGLALSRDRPWEPGVEEDVRFDDLGGGHVDDEASGAEYPIELGTIDEPEHGGAVAQGWIGGGEAGELRRDLGGLDAVPGRECTGNRSLKLLGGDGRVFEELVEAIQERLRPANLVSDATEKVKAATTEKVKSMADTASETAQDMMRGTRERAYDVVEGAKQNPIPALMIGAGVAWLLMSRNKGDGDTRPSEWSQYSPRNERSHATGDNYYRATAADYSDVDSSRRYDYGRQSGSAIDSVTSRAMDVRDSARQTVRQTQNQLQRMLQDNPLLVGAAAVLAGAAIGASLPETERENQMMGEARDSVVDRAQEAARDAASTVREVAGEAVEKVTEKVAPSNP